MKCIDVVGQVALDMVYQGGDNAQSLTSRTKVLHRRIGGKAFNIAAAIARLGFPVRLVTAVGGDLSGRSARESIRKFSIDDSLVIESTWGRDQPIPTPIISLTEGRFGERKVDVSIDPRIESFYRVACDSLYPSQKIRAEHPAAIIFTLEFPDALLPHISAAIRRNKAHSKRTLVVGNPAPRRNEAPSPEVGELLRLADVLTPNLYEERFLLGDRASHQEEPALRVAQMYGSSWVVSTCGRNGWRWAEHSGSHGSGNISPARDVVDKVGASDVFTAMLTVMRISRASVEMASYLAGTAAAIAVSREGGAERFPQMADIREDLRTSPDRWALNALAFLDEARLR